VRGHDAPKEDAMEYFASFAKTTTLSADEARELSEIEGRGARELSEIQETCRLVRVGAELRDAVGFRRGTVDANGDYRLT
jgi:hypothetical protein